MADGAIHQTEGFFTFGMAFALLMLEATLVSLLLRAISRRRGARRMSKLIVAIAFLALNFYIYHFLAREAVIPPREKFAAFPLQIDDWRCARNEPLEPDVAREPRRHRHARLQLRPRRTSWHRSALYIGYHATQVREEGGGSARELDPSPRALPAGLGLGHHRQPHRADRSAGPDGSERDGETPDHREGQAAPARLLLVPDGRARGRRGLAEDPVRRLRPGQARAHRRRAGPVHDAGSGARATRSPKPSSATSPGAWCRCCRASSRARSR